MCQQSIDKNILYLVILLFFVSFGCGKKEIEPKAKVSQQPQIKTGKEIFLEMTKEKEKPITYKKKIVYPKEKGYINEGEARNKLNEEIKKVAQGLNQIIQNKELSEEEKNKEKERLKDELREFMIEGPCELTKEEFNTILKNSSNSNYGL